MNHAVRDALERYLLTMADDELVIGYRATEWTGVAPILEEDIAFSSIGQDEIGHARLYYSLLHDLTGTQVDYRARPPHAYRHAQLLEHPSAPRYRPDGAHIGRSDWAYAVVRQYLYDLFDAERLEALRACAWTPLAESVAKVQREEKYHLLHTRTWIDRLAAGPREARARLERALARAWPDALGLFEPVEGEDLLVAERVLAAGSETLRDRWLARVVPALAAHGLAAPIGRAGAGWEPLITPRLGGRRGRHTDDWQEMWEEMTSVYRLDPTATW
jgi:ring-1,2-phenylacetyl-CoA epoxidase subunit PaaC